MMAHSLGPYHQFFRPAEGEVCGGRFKTLKILANRQGLLKEPQKLREEKPMARQTAIPSIEPWLRSVLRMVVGFTFSLHGLQKLFGIFGGIGGHRVPLFSLMGLAGILETFGGLLILLGLFTMPVAFILSGEMAVAYFIQHSPRGFFPIRNGGELAVLYCFIFLYLFSAGPGPVSLDRLARKENG
jgi:putative oxidoreductase